MSGHQSGGYFAAPLRLVDAIAEAASDPEMLAAWLVLRRFAFGNARELTAAGAKAVATALGITRPRAAKILHRLADVPHPDGCGSILIPAPQHNVETGQFVPVRRRLAPVSVMRAAPGEHAYLPALLVPSRQLSPLARLCGLPLAQDGMACLRLLIHAHAVYCSGDYLGCDPERFPSARLACEGEIELDTGTIALGPVHRDCARGIDYWLLRQETEDTVARAIVEAIVGNGSDDACDRFWRATTTALSEGFLHRLAIVSDDRDRLLYPLWVYGEQNRTRLAQAGVQGDLARTFLNAARRAGAEDLEPLILHAAEGEFDSGVFVAAVPIGLRPVGRQVLAPVLIAPTRENQAGLQSVSALTTRWHRA